MQAPFHYEVVDMSEEEIAREREVFGGLTQSIRRLSEASLLTTVDDVEAQAVQREIDALTERLRASSIPGPFGVRVTSTGEVRGHGNAVVGMRNPVAVPLEVQRADGRAWAEFELNSLYEGPPTKVHGGVVALLLDQIFGETAASAGTPGMTGTLTLRYLTPTPLGKCSAEAWVDRHEGVKTFVKGVMRDADGETTVEAEGVFILPRWAREQLARHQETPPRFE